MPVATLTTDFGLDDYYVAILKGAILCENPDLQLVDITHNVALYDIVQGAFVLKNSFAHFPVGTIHLVSINNYSGNLAFITFQHEGHYFAGPDNGIFSLMFGELPTEVFRLAYDPADPFPLREVFTHAVTHLCAGKPFHEIGLPANEIERRIALQPVISPSQIRGSVIYVDHYENVVVNISKALFEKVRNGRNFALYFKRNDPITTLSRIYHEVPVGETLCLFNATGHLELAINMGKASSMLGLKLDDVVEVNFF
ncbi:MAG: S-adenosyl-l-methionine hydroxide adenosyltransferase family protein [Saprospiraceae bacterium]